MLLAVETSCDETAVTLLEIGKDTDFILAEYISSQVKLHQPYGGVVPELAAREHVINLPVLVDKALSETKLEVKDIEAIAVTRGPGLKGCLLVGVSYCKGLSRALGVPLIPINHLEGHLWAGFLMPIELQPEYPCLSLVVSGGHTLLILMRGFREYETLASTRDDAAGEAFDKVASLLGLPYPGGPALSREAEKGDRTRYPLPIGMAKDLSSFSFSGLKTAVQRLVRDLGKVAFEPQVRADIAASVEWAIVRALVDKSMEHIKSRAEKPKSFLLTGGVAANGFLRKTFAEALSTSGIKFCVPSHRWCTDNASMIGVLGKGIFERQRDTFRTWSVSNKSPLELGPGVLASIGVSPRFPIGSD